MSISSSLVVKVRVAETGSTKNPILLKITPTWTTCLRVK